jgi:hypothetical protein
MRNTSYRRRSGLRITGDLSRMGGSTITYPMVELLPADDPDAIVCGACGVAVRMLSNGRPVCHAAGGYRPNVKQGMYKCEGSGVS